VGGERIRRKISYDGKEDIERGVRWNPQYYVILYSQPLDSVLALSK
jgi:hypothetical protein